MRRHTPARRAAAAAACALALGGFAAAAGQASAAGSTPVSAVAWAATEHGATTGKAKARTAPLATGDPRHVTPSVPRICQRVNAHLSATNGQFPSADELAPPDTARIQAALDACAGTGLAVELSRQGGQDDFLSAPLTVHGREVLLVQAGVTVYASRDPSAYQITGQSACGTIAGEGTGCRPFIDLAGSHSGVMGTVPRHGKRGVIDGRGEMTMLDSAQSWWQLAEQAASGGNQNNPILIQSDGADDLTIYRVELTNSPFYHMFIADGHGLTVWDTVVDTPAVGARNTDGVDPESESDVTIAHDFIQDGDDCVAIKSLPGVPATNITVEHTHCYGTHGISIGSQTGGGISNVLVHDDTLSGTDSLGNVSTSNNGIRIKSDALAGGVTKRVTYRRICLTGVQNPLYFNPFYAAGGSIIPTFKDIVLNGIRAVHSPAGTTSLFEGYDAAHPLQLDLENVRLDDPAQTATDADIGLANSNVVPSGTDVTVTPVRGHGSVPSCRFPAFTYPPLP